MANVTSAFGLKLVGHRKGASFNARVRPYFLPSGYGTATFIGDPVVKTGTGNTTVITAPGVGRFNVGTIQEVNKATAGDANRVTGVIVGFAANPDNLTQKHNPASTERVALVCDDPDAVFEIDADGAIPAASIGLNAVFIYTLSGSTVTGLSGVQLDTTSDVPAADASNQLLILGAVNREDVDTTLTRSKVLVQIINHTEAAGNTAAGDGILGV